jgi:ribonuclease R
LIKAESKEYYEGKIDMTEKTAYFVCPELEKMFYSTNNKSCLRKDIVKVYV